ncbi:type II secretion system F family protein [Burkholderia orbicola]|uniref:type II secretion system F family protein n=1 Tax=Burkholderia cepacia complex TaxID=87882 RepID=UPI001907C859|nr:MULTISPECIES: type II secretion system F family protein [Burkholderia cepacia complex]MBJ9594183.1 type II secretion system F family protein [Burkholderia seminalis]MDN7472559.1 type II secretion system F family protein [Burkholderia orbicola]MDN7507429.1 type II secretion system F family protein [Burkholderia orbicola]
MNGFFFPLFGSLFHRRRQRIKPLSWALRLRIYEDAIQLLPQGQSPSQVLVLLRQSLLRRKKRAAAQQVHRVYLALEDGSSFAQALGVGLPDMERSVLEIGERSSEGGLPKAMRQIIETRARIVRIQTVAWSSIVDPIVYVICMYGFFYVVGDQVTPSIELMLPREKWTGWTALLGWFGDLGQGFAPAIAALLAAVFVTVTVEALPRWIARARVWVEEVYFVFTVYREFEGTRWMLNFVTQVKGGVPQADAIAQQIRRASPWLASRLRPVYRSLIEGHQLGDSLRSSGLGFPSPDLIERIATLDGAEGGADALEALAHSHADVLEKRMRRLSKTVGAICLIVIFIVIGLVTAASNGMIGNMAGSIGM